NRHTRSSSSVHNRCPLIVNPERSILERIRSAESAFRDRYLKSIAQTDRLFFLHLHYAEGVEGVGFVGKSIRDRFWESVQLPQLVGRSEERRVGKEGRCRRSPAR